MLRTLLGWFVVAHGLLTIVIWSPNPRAVDGSAPMDTRRSWLFGDARTVSLVLAVVAGMIVAAAGMGFVTHQAWWSIAGVVGGVLSLVLFALFFTPCGQPRSRSAQRWWSPQRVLGFPPDR